MKNREQAVQAALEAVGDEVEPRTCQKWTRELYGAPSVGDVDGDGASDAEDGWKSEPKSARHPGDRTPEDGTPVSWEGGSEDNGHRAIYVGNNEIVGVDMPHPGKIGKVDLDWVTRNWGLSYVGWSDTISGKQIPKGNPPKQIKEPRPNSDLGKALARLRSALARAERNGYKARADELKKEIQNLLELPKKK